MSTSAKQQEVFRLAQELFPLARVVENYSLDNRQFLDVYIKEFDIGIEVDGPQHDTFHPFFHASIADFHLQKMLDRKKEVRCKELGISLIRIKEQEHVDKDILLSRILDTVKNHANVLRNVGLL